MKSLITFLLFSFVGLQVHAQTTEKKQVFEIHKLLEKMLSSDAKYSVYGTTKKNIIRNFDFKNPDGLDTSASNVWKKAEWKNFLNNVDISTVSDYSLSTASKPWFKNTGKSKDILVFAPVILSPDGNLAISILELTNTRGRSSTSRVYFLQKENGKWSIKQDRPISLTDHS